MLDSAQACPIEHETLCEATDFVPPWWLRGGHRQTLFSIIAKLLAPSIVYERERWRTPDGDFIDLDWLKSTALLERRTLHVIFHGLASDSHAAPIRDLVSAIERRGERAVVVHFRGCSGVLNRKPRGYHSADSDEIDWILRRIRATHPQSKVCAIGYSLGAAALLKWLGEPARHSREFINKAVAISPPVDLGSAANAVSRGFSRFYSWGLVGPLKRATRELIERFPELTHKLDVKRIRDLRTLAEFDALVTAPLHGFTLEEYHGRGSSRHGLRNVVVPTLILAAQDDPIVLKATIEGLEYSATVQVDHQRYGGHAAFYCFSQRHVVNWASGRTLSFVSGERPMLSAPPTNEKEGLGGKAWGAAIAPPLLEAFMLFLRRHPGLHRVLFGLLRRHAPVSRRGAFAIVTGAGHVHEVLNRKNDFLLAPINQHKVLVGDFLLSLDPGPQYDREKAIVHSVFPRGRVAEIERCATEAADRLLTTLANKSNNSIDVVHLAERVMVEITNEFWGLDSHGATSAVLRAESGEETMRFWLRYLGVAIASPGNQRSGTMRLAQRCRDEFVCFVQDACQAPNPRGFLGALVRAAPHIAPRNVAGIVVTASVVVTKAFINALIEIMKRDEVRRWAIEAAAREDGREALAKIVVEALRFNPVFPFLARYSPRATSIRGKNGEAIEIQAGSLVLVSALAAMFDPEAMPDPENFHAGRDLQLNPKWVDATGKYGCPHAQQQGPYFHFSSGSHRCPADQLAIAEVTAMMMAILKLENPRLSGRLRYDGLAADKLIVRFGA